MRIAGQREPQRVVEALGSRRLADRELRATLMGRLVAVSDLLRDTASVESAAAAIGRAVLQLTGASRAAVFLRLPTGVVTCPWCHNLSDDYIGWLCTPPGANPWAHLSHHPELACMDLPARGRARSAPPSIVEDMHELPAGNETRRAADREGLRALSSWPLSRRGRVFAAVAYYFDTPHVCADPEREVVLAFALQATAALEQAMAHGAHNWMAARPAAAEVEVELAHDEPAVDEAAVETEPEPAPPAEAAFRGEPERLAALQRALETEAARLSAERTNLAVEREQVAGAQHELEEERARLTEMQRALEAEARRLTEMQHALEGDAERSVASRRQLDADEKRLAELQKVLGTERANISETRRTLDTEVGQMAGLRNELDAAGGRLTEARRGIDAEAARLAEARTALETERGRLSALQSDLEAKQKQFEQSLDEAHGQFSSAEADLAKQRAALEVEAANLAQARRELEADRNRVSTLVRSLEPDRARIAEMQQTFEAERARLEDVCRTLDSEKTDLNSAHSTLAAEFNRLSGAVSALMGKLRQDATPARTDGPAAQAQGGAAASAKPVEMPKPAPVTKTAPPTKTAPATKAPPAAKPAAAVAMATPAAASAEQKATKMAPVVDEKAKEKYRERVAVWAEAGARALACKDDEIADIRKAARLFDAETPEAAGGSSRVAAILRHYGEHWNGSGKPDGLKEQDIPLGARLLAVTLAYAAMVIGGPEQPMLYYLDAKAALKREAGKKFDPDVVKAFCRVVNRA